MKLNQYRVHSQEVLKVSGCPANEKNNQIRLASLKALANSEDCSERRIRISVPALLRTYWSIV
jgi:hypothetical protein